TESHGDKIGKMSPAGVVLAEYVVPTSTDALTGITLGPDGNVWFLEEHADKVGKITPAGSITEFSISFGSLPHSIVTGPDGNLWFTEYASNRIGRLTPAGGYVEFAIPTANSLPTG